MARAGHHLCASETSERANGSLTGAAEAFGPQILVDQRLQVLLYSYTTRRPAAYRPVVLSGLVYKRADAARLPARHGRTTCFSCVGMAEESNLAFSQSCENSPTERKCPTSLHGNAQSLDSYGAVSLRRRKSLAPLGASSLSRHVQSTRRFRVKDLARRRRSLRFSRRARMGVRLDVSH